MIRDIEEADRSAVLAVAEASGLFSDDQRSFLAGLFQASLDDPSIGSPFWRVSEDDGISGILYCEPERMTEGTWNLQLIAVHPRRQRCGCGRDLLRNLEQQLTGRGARLVLVETAGTAGFDGVRRFYHANGYREEARIREFYTAGVDKVTCCKMLQ